MEIKVEKTSESISIDDLKNKFLELDAFKVPPKLRE